MSSRCPYFAQRFRICKLSCTISPSYSFDIFKVSAIPINLILWSSKIILEIFIFSSTLGRPLPSSTSMLIRSLWNLASHLWYEWSLRLAQRWNKTHGLILVSPEFLSSKISVSLKHEIPFYSITNTNISCKF